MALEMSDKLQFVADFRRSSTAESPDKLKPKSAGKKLADLVSVNVCRTNNDFCELCLFTQKVKAAAAAFSSVKFVAAPDRLFEEL